MQMRVIQTIFIARFIEQGIQLVKKLSTFYETHEFNEIFWKLCRNTYPTSIHANLIHSTYSYWIIYFYAFLSSVDSSL
jgi:hypothetical protein